MKKVLVTGAYGFIGSNLARRLIRNGCDVHVISRKETNRWRVHNLDFQDHTCDLRDSAQVDILVKEIRPDTVYHLAAYGCYPTFQQDLNTIVQTNIMGALNLFSALSKTNYEVLINTGSSSEYGLKSRLMSENDLLEPTNAYGVSKAAITLLCKVLGRSIVTIRPFSVYGYYEEPTRLIPYVITSCLRSKELKLTKGKQTRDFIFIEDIVDAYIKAGTTPKARGEILNIGSGTQHTVEETVLKIVQLCNKDVGMDWGALTYREGEANCWVADITKAKRVLDWEPKYTLEQGLGKTVKWFIEGGLEKY